MKEIEILNKICPLYKNATSKRELRHSFFKNIETEIQAYLLGFFAADGSLDEKRNMLRIKLQKRDNEIIELFKTISPNARIFTDGNYESKATVRSNVVKTNTVTGIEITSKFLKEDLIKLGIYANKTYKELNIPNLSEGLIIHFIRGYFDGDGSIIGSIRKPNAKNREKNYRLCVKFEICSKTKTILNDIQTTFNKYDINSSINFIKRDSMYRLSVSSKKSVDRLYKKLYENSTFYLKRKFNKFNYYVNTEVSQIISDNRNA